MKIKLSVGFTGTEKMKPMSMSENLIFIITNRFIFNFLNIPERYEKCLLISALVKVKSLSTPANNQYIYSLWHNRVS